MIQLIQEIRNGRKYLVGANLSLVDLCEANLYGANLRGADLRSANLNNANLCWADLRGADLSLANLREADLRSANLNNANLRGADLRRANLNGTNFSDANLTSTILPNGQIYAEYLKTLPKLFTATGRKFEEIVTKDHWNCHHWDNCPMAVVFSVRSLSEIPATWRQRVKDFITYFDARMLPFEIVIKLQ